MDQPPSKPPGQDDGPRPQIPKAASEPRPHTEAPTIKLPSPDAQTTLKPGDLRHTTPLVASELPGVRRPGLQTETLEAPVIPSAPPPDLASEALTAVMPKVPETPTHAPAPVATPPAPAPTAPDLLIPPPQASTTQHPQTTLPPPPERPKPPQRPSRPPSPASSGVRIAARSQANIPRPIAWGAGVVLVALSGLALWAARQPIDQSLDRWLTLPTFERVEPVAQDTPQPVQEAAPVEKEESGPVWDFPTIEEALTPLPDQVQALSTAGRQEQADFADLAQRDAPAALQQSRWDNWRQVWQNRTAVPRQAMPPVDECLPHAALEAACVAVHQALLELEGISGLPRADSALNAFDRADAVLEAWRTAKEEEEAAALEAAALEAEAAAQEAQAAGELTDEILDATDDDRLIAEPVEEENLLPPDG